mmetsp:Transcript_9072/g.25929  ORF Transcript_9072/g.25929 Transcript_9072/m.25929 type:complete len:286 (-) Transcript_9072:193-1050(-)
MRGGMGTQRKAPMQMLRLRRFNGQSNNRPWNHRSRVHEELPVLILDDAKIVVQVLEANSACRRAALVPRQQLPDRANRHLDAPDPLSQSREPRDRLRGRVVHLHLDVVPIHLCLGGRNDTAAKGREKLPPSEDGYDSQGEYRRVELGVQVPFIGFDHLCHATNLTGTPGTGLELMELEEEVCLIFAKGLGRLAVFERFLDSKEERAGTEYPVWHRREHELPLPCDACKILGQGLWILKANKCLHLSACCRHSIAILRPRSRVEGLPAVQDSPEVQDLGLEASSFI